ncbi:subtelomeric ABC-transporter family member protein protein [Babesia ovis]|uniref:Subtelomeric ABC-transporter family member protein protein n=1 Tax=Babesia ovis TaxID=5869 RepID=A0A9W5T8L3_BABOV|nr:subtelomeric ABC-transporter family member protein protein [Babesia ovis]
MMRPPNTHIPTDKDATSRENVVESNGTDDGRLASYDDPGLLNFLLLRWAKSWMKHICTHILRPEKIHRLPEADQIAYWQPILSKHVSDGLLQLEQSQRDAVSGGKDGEKTKPYRHILLRAILLTFWRRIVATLLVMILIAAATAGTVMLLKHLLTLLSNKEQNWAMIVSLVFSIVVIEVANTFLDQHANLYNMRLQNIMEASIAITLFQHGLCHRRDYPNIMRAHGVRQGCKSALHSGSSLNGVSCEVLTCPARRHQNGELPASMYTFLFIDTYYIVALVDASVMLLRFLCNVTLGIVLIYTQTGMGVLHPLIIIAVSIVIMVLVEVVNACNIIHSLRSKDDRISKSSDTIGSLKMLKVAGIEDIGYNIIENSRNDELVVLQSRLSLFTINRSLMRVIGSVVYIVIIIDFIAKLRASGNDTNFDVSVPITLLHIVSTIVGSFDHLLKSLKITVEGVTSIRRVEAYLKTCSPNFYLTNRNVVTGSPRKSLSSDVPKCDETMDKNTLVVFKNVSFCWFNKIEDVLTQRGRETHLFTDVNFELKRGDIRIITGNQGSGKTSFIKSILGEMTLVSGSMAVAPLSTDMPIFYSSQDVWLPSGTIRSIITFGHIYDEEVYNTVVRCVELESDFKSWVNGDLREISEQGYSLSGGQRVRVGLARALYGYMIFSKANEQLEDRCCFLVCLDEPFNGLDPNVTLSVFNNLFNRETGLLVRDDVAVVMTASKSLINESTSRETLGITTDIYVHHIKGDQICNGTLLGTDSSPGLKTTKELIANQELRPKEPGIYEYFTEFQKLNLLDSEMDNSVDADNSCAKGALNVGISPSEDPRKRCATGAAYGTYIYAMGMFYSIAVFTTLTTAVVLDKVFGVMVANWSDIVRSIESSPASEANRDQILQKHDDIARYMKILVTSFVSFVFIGMFIAIFANIHASKKIHRFIMNSIFQMPFSENQSKGYLAKIVTFLTSDIYYIDEHVGRFIVATLFSFLNICAQFITICYSVPILSPIPIGMVIILYLCVVKDYLVASKMLQYTMLEANNAINTLYGDVISGSGIYRSFRKEHVCIKRVCTHSENFYAIKFLKLALTAWTMLTCKLIAVILVLCASFVPIIYAYIRGDELNVAQVGLGISYSLGINSLLNAFIFNFSMLEKQMCSMVRFREYFLGGNTSFHHKFDTVNETIMMTDAFTEYLGDNQKRWSGLVKRRKEEYRNFAFRKYLSSLGVLFYKPKLEFLDCAFYLPGEHTTIELNDVSVSISPKEESREESYLLKHISATANAGDIIGIVGRTGTGKSTFLATLQNIVPHREGSVLIDGRELSSIPRKVLRHIVGVLPQIPFVHKGWTLRRFLDPRMLYSDDEIMTALECCGLQDLVSTATGANSLDTVLVPQNITVAKGLYLIPPLLRLRGPKDTNVSVEGKEGDISGNSHCGFSTNQLRQLSFARLVLYRKTYRILLIDEPPAENCDASSHGVSSTSRDNDDIGMPIYDLVRLHFRHCTTFIVAHNKNALKSCTSVWIMRDGTFVRKCTSEEFMANGRRIMENIDLYLSEFIES